MNIGRLVKAMVQDGHQHGVLGRLVEAKPDWAIVRLVNRTTDDKVPWKNITDVTSRNATPLILPEPAPPPAPTTMKTNQAMKILPQTATEKQADAKTTARAQIEAALGEIGVLELGDAGNRIAACVADVRAAEAALKETRAAAEALIEESEAVVRDKKKRLAELREAAQMLLAMIDKA
jgi:hypothetical protein